MEISLGREKSEGGGRFGEGVFGGGGYEFLCRMRAFFLCFLYVFFW